MSGIYKTPEGERAVRERYVEILKHWPIPNRQLRIPTREGETFVVECGAENAPALLLFHGSGTNAAMWMGDVTAWAEHFRIYAVDLIGEPGLSAPSRPVLQSEAHALWLDDVMQALAISRVSMVGASLGGWLALDYATRRPEHVESAAVLCPAGVGRQRKSFLFKIAPLLLMGGWGRRKAMRIALGPGPANVRPAVQFFAHFMGLIFTHFRPRRETIPVFNDQALGRLTMPVLAIVGGRDAMIDSYETKRRLEKLAPRASVCLLPEAGHGLRGQTSRILEFLRGSA